MPQLGINGLEPGFKYNVRVRGIFSGTPGEWSPTEEIDVFSDITSGTGDKNPSVPISLAVVPTIDSFILTWQAPTTNFDGTALRDMKDYVIEVRNDSYGGTLDATYTLPEYQKPGDLSATERERTFEFTYKMNKELYGGSGAPVMYFKVYARDATNNKSVAAQATGTNASPSAPTSLSATGVVGGVNVTWGGGTSNDIVAYTLKVSTSNGFDPLVAGTEIYRGNLTNYSYNGTAGTTYYFRVGSVDTFGQVSWYASQASAAPSGGSVSYSTPNPPTSLVDSWVGANYRIAWTASTTPAATDIDRYKIEVTANSVTKTYWTSGVFYDIDPQVGKDFGGAWPYTPTLINVYSVGPSNLISSALAKSSSFASAPSTPTAPALSSTLAAGGIAVTWSAPSDPNAIIDEIEIYAGTSASPTTLAWSGKGTAFVYSISPLFNGTYFFRSRVRDVFGRVSSFSSDDSEAVTTVGAPTSLSMSSALDPADATNRTSLVSVNFTTPNSIAYGGSKVRYRIGAGLWTEVDLGGIGGPNTAVTYNLRNLIPNTTYRVEVICYDFKGTLGNGGAWVLADADGDILTAQDTTAPAGSLTPSGTSGATSILVSWTGVTDADVINGNGRYDIELATNVGYSTGVLKQTQPGGVSGQTHVASFTGLTPSTSYYARVRAVDATGNLGTFNNVGAPTAIVVGSTGTSKTDGAVPSTSPAATTVSGIDAIHVRWAATSNNDPVTYEVHISTSAGFTPTAGGATMVGTIDGTYMAITTDGSGAALAYGTNYYVRLFARDADGPAAAPGTVSSATQVAKVDGTADITDGTIVTAKLVDASVTAAKLGAAIGGGNMLSGASFEQDANSDGVADNWTNTSSGTITSAPTISSAEKIYGTNSQRIQITASATTGYRGTFQTITIPAGALTKVTASVWYKGSRTGTGQFDFILGNSAFSSFVNTAFTPTATWQRAVLTWTVPGADTTARVEIRARAFTIADTVDLYLDGVQLEVGDVPTSWAPKPDEILPGTVGTTEISALAVTAAKIAANTITAAQIAANTLTATEIAADAITASELAAGAVTANKLAVIVGGGNILANSGYESWSAGLPTSWTKGGNTTLTQVTGRLGVGSATRHTATTAGNVGTNRLSQALTTNQTLAINTTYTLSAYVKRNSGTGGLSVAFDGLSTFVLAPAGSVTTSFVRYSVTFTTGGTAPNPMGLYNTVANDVFEIDDIQLETGDVPTSWTPRTDEILPGTIVASMIAADTITANEIAANAITVSELAANAVTATKIAAGVIDTSHINATGINADKINIGGNASNMVPTEYADLEATAGLYAAGQPFGLAAVGAPTAIGTSAVQAKFGTRSATLTLNLANQGIYLATSATTYNIPVTSGKTYILSAYIFSSASQNVTVSVKNTGGGPTPITMGVTAVTAGSWQRVYGSFTAGADAVDNISITFSGTSGIQYIDGVMMEERIGTQSVPSGFVKPSTVIDGAQIITGSLNADRIVAGSITTSQFTAGTIDGAIITAGTITAGSISISGSGSNILPLESGSFEYVPSYYTAKYSLTGGGSYAVGAAGASVFGSQSLGITWGTTGTGAVLWFSPTTTTYQIPVKASTKYIYSAYVKAASVTSARLVWKGNVSATVSSAGAVTVTSAYTKVSGTFTTGASDVFVQVGVDSPNSATVMYMDGVMLEEALGGGIIPSGWTSPSSTTIDGSGINTGTLDADRLKANSAVITTLTLGIGTSTAGEIRSGNYSAGVTGWRIGQDAAGVSTLDIATGTINAGTITAGTIAAARLTISGTGSNIIPSETGSFEYLPSSYVGKYLGTVATYAVAAGNQQFGANSLGITWTGTGAGSSLWFAPTATTYNIPVKASTTYIYSIYTKAASVTSARLIWKGNVGATLSSAGTITPTSSYSRLSGTFTTGASDTFVQVGIDTPNSATLQYVDGVMLEEKIGGSNTPSTWAPSGTSSIDGSSITTGTIDASLVNVTNINATLITTGTLTASRLGIGGSGINLIPPQWSDFEFDPYYYVGKMDGANATALAATDQVYFGSQSIKATTTVQPNNTIFFGISNTDYNFRVVPSTTYILSAYIYQATGSAQTVSFRYKPQFTGANNDFAATVVGGTTSIASGSWQRIYATFTTGASDDFAVMGVRAFSAIGSYYMDGVMLEKQVGNATLPSPWVGAPQTVIDGNQITTGYLNANRISLGLFGSNQIENGAFEDTGYYPRVPQRVPATLSNTGVIPGWTTQRIGGDASSFHALEWGNYTSDGNMLFNGRMNNTPAINTTPVSCTFTDAGDLVTATNHGLTDGTVIRFTTITTTTGITVGTSYYVVQSTASTFKVSTTPGGSAIALTTNGTGNYIVPGSPSGWSEMRSGTTTLPYHMIDNGTNATTPVTTYRILRKESVTTTRVVQLDAPLNISRNDQVTVTDLTSYTGTNMAVTNYPVTFDATADTVVSPNHQLANGTRIQFVTIVTTTGISVNLNYYVTNATADTFQVTADVGGTAFQNLTTNGSGTYWVYDTPVTKVAYTSSSVTDAESVATPNGFLSINRSQKIVTSGMSSGAVYGVYQSLPITQTSLTPVIANFKYNISARATTELRLRLYGQFSITRVQTTTGTNLVTITTRTAHGLSTSNTVEVETLQVNDDPGSPSLAGSYTITVTGANTFTYTNGTAVATSDWVPVAGKVTHTASLQQTAALTTTGSWQTSASVSITPNGNYDAIKVAPVVVATAGSSSITAWIDTVTATEGAAVVTDPFTSTLAARSGQAKAVLGKADASTTRGTSLTSDPIAVTGNQTYLLGFYYYGDINQNLVVTFEYSATTSFSSPTVFSPTDGVVNTTTSISPSGALNRVLAWDAAASGYLRAVFKNSGTAEKGTIYVEDIWLAIQGRTSGELTDAGIRLFDENGNETVSLMADSSDSGDFIKLGKSLILDGAAGQVSAQHGAYEETLSIQGLDIAEYIAGHARGVIARGNRSSNLDFINGEVPHSNWAGGATVNSGIPYMELSIDGMDAARDYRISVNGVRIFNTNANSTFADVSLGYRSSTTAIPAMPRADTAAGLTDVIMRQRFGKQANQNVTQQSFERVWNPPASGNYRFLVYGASDVNAPGGTVRFDSQSAQPTQIVIEDLGLTISSSGVNRGATSPDTDTRKITKTLNFPPIWSGYYDPSGNLLDQAFGLEQPEGWIQGGRGIYRGRSIYVIYDQPVDNTGAGTNPNAITSKTGSAAVVNSVWLDTTVRSSGSLNVYGGASTGTSYPYYTYAQVPDKTPTFSALYKMSGGQIRDGNNSVSLANVGVKNQWADPSATTRYRGFILGIGDEFNEGEWFIRNLYVNFTITE